MERRATYRYQGREQYRRRKEGNGSDFRIINLDSLAIFHRGGTMVLGD